MQRLKTNLSYAEREVAKVLSEQLPNGGSVVVGSLMEKTGHSRTTGVNVLKKLGMAGIVETSSRGRSGTYVRVINEKAWKMLKDIV